MSWLSNLFLRRTPKNPLFTTSEPGESLIGKIALSVTPLRTSGMIELDGVKYEVVSLRGFIPANTKVKIVGRRMGWFTVEPFDKPTG